MESTKNHGQIFEKLKYGMEHFPARQKKLCSFINANYQEAAFMTIDQLSYELQIGVATVTRTIHNLGYTNYKEFTHVLRELLVQQKSTYWRELKDSWEQDETQKPSVNKLAEITQHNIRDLESSLSQLTLDNFSNAVALMKRAKKISILGLRSSRAVSYYLYYILNEFMDNVSLADTIDSAEIFANMITLTPEDVFVVISLGGPNYAARTHEAVNFAYSKGIPIILITSDLRNPSSAKATYILLVPVSHWHYSLVPTMNLVDAIIANMGSMKSIDRMNELEQISTYHNIVL